MGYVSSESQSLFHTGGRRRIQGSSIHAGRVYGGAGGSGVHIFQASRPLLVGAPRVSLCGRLSPGLDLGVGVGSGVGSGLGVGVGSGLGVGVGSGLGVSSAAGFGAGFKSGSAFIVDAGFGGGAVGADIGILGNEKFTMRFLNDRLATYLKKVRLLEKANAELEQKIRQFVDSRTSPTARDYSDSLTTITDLQAKILDDIRLNGVIFVNLDNASLAADDFRIKYENEWAIRQSVEADIAGLKRLLDDINLRKKELILHIDTLNEEMVSLKKIHQEEMVTARSQMSGQIHVEVKSAPQENLTSILEDIRDYYNNITAKNRREVEAWFKGKLETLKQDVASSTKTVETSETEMTTKRTKVQNLELELQSILAVNTSLDEKHSETQTFYATHLSGYQLQVTSLEEQLLKLRADLERQGRDYQMLLDIKTRLEQEIAEYRRLLDVGATGSVLVVTDKSSTVKGSVSITATSFETEEKVEK